MLRLAKLLLYCGYCSIGVVLALLYLDPARFEQSATRAVMAEYVSQYCHKDTRHDVNYQIGGAAAISRVVVKADLGTLAQIEYLRCKM